MFKNIMSTMSKNCDMIVKMTLQYQIDIKIISNSTWEFVFGPQMDV